MDCSRKHDDVEERLKCHGIRPTAVRNMLVGVLDRAGRPVTAQEIESELQTVDRSTISRSLSVFAENGLLHVIDDGSGVPKYECCPSHHHHADDSHAHFHCRRCGRTFCLEDIETPVPQLPEGYFTESSSLILTGICPACNH